MPTLTCQPSGRSAAVPAGTGLLEAARLAGETIHAPCGGKGACGKCAVQVLEGTLEAGAPGRLSAAEVAAGWVLACRARVGGGDCVVRVSEAAGLAGGKFSDQGGLDLVDPALLPSPGDLSPLVTAWAGVVPPPRPEDGLSDLDRISRALPEDLRAGDLRFALPALRETAAALRADEGRVRLLLAADADRSTVVRVLPVTTRVEAAGLAVDLGTTTVALHLVRLSDGAILSTRTEYNGQIPCGLDVISRINWARRAGGLGDLRDRAVATINRLADLAASDAGLAAGDVIAATISGNTTMTHLLLGLDPEAIRLAPYTPTAHGLPLLAAGDLGLNLHPAAPVHLSPAVGSYVGGDITAGLLCTSLAAGGEGLRLFLDIGTNGEIVLGDRDFLLAAACSAGPAFEGGGIACGMRAARGAIERVAVDDAGRLSVSTVGDAPALGICGSGMISLLAGLRERGYLDPAGRFSRGSPLPGLEVQGRQARATLAPPPFPGGRPVTVGELDVDNLMRAKAAIYAAVSRLLAHAGAGAGDLSRVYLAGGFGRHLDLDQAVAIGLLPDLPRERFRYVGNSSLSGSYALLLSGRHRRLQAELARRLTYLDLGSDPAYMDAFTAALFLPHTDRTLFPSVR